MDLSDFHASFASSTTSIHAAFVLFGQFWLGRSKVFCQAGADYPGPANDSAGGRNIRGFAFRCHFSDTGLVRSGGDGRSNSLLRSAQHILVDNLGQSREATFRMLLAE
ncbi:MAG: hypothetical protein M3Y72_13355 [Acidobacteriota bacterium]|nr:hypothetical protein [Acidobacteriota bacterium]